MAGVPSPVSLQDLLTDMALYFAAFRLPSARDDCYSALIACLRDTGLIGARLGMASLNYEILFELAAARLEIGVSVAPLPPAAGGITVWKPHGACNLIAEPVARGLWREMRVERSQYMVGGDSVELVPVPLDQIAELYAGQRNIPPAMSLYAPGKHSPVAPAQLAAARQQWSAWAQEADVVVAVGVRHVVEDSHVWTGILDGSGDLCYVGDEQSAVRLRGLAGPRLTHIGEQFRESLPALTSRLRLLA